MKIRHSLLAASLALIVLPGLATAYTVFQATLNSEQQVPLSASVAYGSAQFILNDAQTEVLYHVEIHNLEGAEVRAQIHNAATGQNGPTLGFLPLGDVKDGVWMLSAFEVEELMSGRVYIDIHSSAYPHGEIRGDMGPAPVAVEGGNWSALKALY